MKVAICFGCGNPFLYRGKSAPSYCSAQCRDAREEKLANALGKIAESMGQAAEEEVSSTPNQSSAPTQRFKVDSRF